MTSFDPLTDELDRWLDTGRQARLWWRDDDAVTDGPALRRLVAAAEHHQVPLALAVIPARLDPALGHGLPASVGVLQHGYAHINHAAPGGRAVECGGARSLEMIADEFAEGRKRLEAVFADRFLPVMVPPWNRIEAPVAAALPALGFRRLSVFGPRPFPPEPSSENGSNGQKQINAHLDLLTWKGGARFAGADKLVRLAAERLADRRLARSDPDEPFGLLTHHLDHDEAVWDFLDLVLAVLTSHPAVVFPSLDALFAETEPGA